MKQTFFLAALLSLMAAPLILSQETSADGAAVDLKPQFFPGKVYNYVTNTEVRLRLPQQPGQAAPAERQVGMEHHARLEIGQRATPEGVAIEAKTDRLKMEIASGDKKISYDSGGEQSPDSPQAELLSRHFDGATKRTVSMELDGGGKIVKATEGGGGGSATPLPGLPQFGPDELKQLVVSLMQGFPPDPVKLGEEWVQKGKRSLGQFGEIDFEITYRYAGDETFEGAECARIDYQGEVKGDVAVSGSGGSGKLGFEGNELNGKLIFDKLRKAVRFSEQTVEMNVDAPAANAPSGKIRLPMKQKVTSKLVGIGDA